MIAIFFTVYRILEIVFRTVRTREADQMLISQKKI